MILRNSLINLALFMASVLCGFGVVAIWKNGIPKDPPKLSAQQFTKIHAEQFKEIQSTVKMADLTKVFNPRMPQVILFLRSGCAWCEKSMPLYQSLSKLPAIKSHKLMLAAFLPDNIVEANSYLNGHQLFVNAVLPRQKLEDYGIKGTPLVLFVNDGKLIDAWTGYQQNPEEVVKAISKYTQS